MSPKWYQKWRRGTNDNNNNNNARSGGRGPWENQFSYYAFWGAQGKEKRIPKHKCCGENIYKGEESDFIYAKTFHFCFRDSRYHHELELDESFLKIIFSSNFDNIEPCLGMLKGIKHVTKMAPKMDEGYKRQQQ